MACNFQIPFQISVESAVQKARSAVESQNGHFSGDEYSGEFDVTILNNFIRGSYTVQGQILDLTIIDKPIFLPCSMIESFLKKEIS